MERDFMRDAGAYELPEDVKDQQVEVFEFYEHQPGEYTGFLGKLKPIYKDANGKSVPPDAPGATLNAFQLPIWIFQALGNLQNATVETRITPDYKLAFDINKQSIHSAVFNLYLPYADQKSQWQNVVKFEKFMFPGNDESRLVKVNPNMRTQKTVCFRNFPKYYGMPVNFTLAEGKKRVYVESIRQGDVSKIVPASAIAELEKQLEAIIEEERKKRNEDNYVPEAPPETDFDSLASEDLDAFSQA